jgi:sugar lactone lactonase YvrE
LFCPDREITVDGVEWNPNGVALLFQDNIAKTIYAVDSEAQAIYRGEITDSLSTLQAIKLDLDDYKMSAPSGIAISSGKDGAYFIYIADTNNHRLLQISPNMNGKEWIVSQFAGSGQRGNGNGDGNIKQAQFDQPMGLALDQEANVYVADMGNHRIRKIENNQVSLIAGSDEGYQDGKATEAKFRRPSGVALDNQGNTYVADTGNNLIRKIDNKGQVSTIAGSGQHGYRDGVGLEAKFHNPMGISIDREFKYLYVADSYNGYIRRISLQDGRVSTVFQDRRRSLQALFFEPRSIAIDQHHRIYIVDHGFWNVRRISGLCGE